ncbi:MAG TPA: antibiotic biosynthesis monooxygenase [Bryobacteraceae bacterium]|nr:antibiotic biosynthesis monooxygenase [Bryobacteraceae bacterium]
MPIYTIAEYKVRPSGVDKVMRAIEEFVPYVQANEAGTRMYLAWQQKADPTQFVHFFIFEDEAAHQAHGRSEAVKRFEAAYRPELVGGDVVFTDYHQVASNQETERDGAGNARAVLQKFYEAVIKRDFAACRGYLSDDFLFKGLFRTYSHPDEYLADLKQLLQITVRLDMQKMIVQGSDVMVLFELETKAPAAATTLVAEWHRVTGGKITRVQSVFDGRPFEAMFAGPGSH